MGFLKNFISVFGSVGKGTNFWFYVKCDTCKEVLKGRLDMVNDLSLVYSEDNKESTYYCRKVLVGSHRCYRPIEVEFRFDSNRKLIDRNVQGGEFVSEEVYLRSQDTPT